MEIKIKEKAILSAIANHVAASGITAPVTSVVLDVDRKQKTAHSEASTTYSATVTVNVPGLESFNPEGPAIEVPLANCDNSANDPDDVFADV